MDNTKDAIIYIINIGAEELANPNWSIEAKRLFIQYCNDYTENLLSYVPDLSYWLPGFNVPDIDADEFVTKAKENLDIITGPKFRTDFYKIKEEKRDSLYSSYLPVSLDTLKLKRLFPNELYTMTKKSGKSRIFKGDIFSKTGSEKLYTDAIIDVTFDNVLHQMADKLQIINKPIKNTTKQILDFKEKYRNKNIAVMNLRALRKKFYSEGITLTPVSQIKYSVKLNKNPLSPRRL